MREHCFGGYILSTVKDHLHNTHNPDEIDAILHKLSVFTIDYQSNTRREIDPICAVYENIISRGLPTIPNLLIEETISEEFNIGYRSEDKRRPGTIIFEPGNDLSSLVDDVYKALFIIDPRIEVERKQEGKKSFIGFELSESEKKFVQTAVPDNYGDYLIQLLEPQREFTSLHYQYPGNGPYLCDAFEKERGNFDQQRIDFSIDLVNTNGSLSSIAIEIDDPSHLVPAQRVLDSKRDRFLTKAGWAKTIRIPSDDIEFLPASARNELSDFLKHPHATLIRDNYNLPLWLNENGLVGMQIALSPFALARVQKGILLAMKEGLLDLSQPTWKIAIVERDVPCAFLAVADLKKTFDQLFLLEGESRQLPEIKLKVFTTREFVNCALNRDLDTVLIDEYSSENEFDLTIDVSMLQRTGFAYPVNCNIRTSNKTITIRSVHSIIGQRKVVSGKPLFYSVSDVKQDDASLTFFLQNIFRKERFLDGQIDILQRTLMMQSVVALLPTGAGKSLTYQLSSMLQPGITLIVDPLKSLMIDQDRSLKNSGIDSTIFINSSLKSPSRRKKLSEEMRDGLYQFVFISPERLQIQEFRDYLGEMQGSYITYCVVDEAHCVSEWGHDFRTPYLKLGENARKYCKVHPKSVQMPLIGLTGTASFDVLEDVRRELFVEDTEYSVVRPSKIARDELIFRVIEIPDIGYINKPDKWSINKAISEIKKNYILKVLRDLRNESWSMETTISPNDHFLSNDSDYPNSGIIFCPHVKWVHGVLENAEFIKKNLPEISDITDIYAGKLADDGIQIDLEEIQKKFMNNQLNLLVATKAFGMGIDKPNIRFTIHYSMPQSIEAFYQEAGRAGRDRQTSYCYVIHSSTPIEKDGDKELSVDKKLMLSFHHNSFPGIEKEKKIIWELLNQVDSTNETNAKITNVDDLDLEIPIIPKVWRKGGSIRIYANTGDGGSIGYVIVNSTRETPPYIVKVSPNNLAVDPTKADSVLRTYANDLARKRPVGLSLKDWLTETKNRPGIEPLLEGLDYGETTTLLVPFENSVPDEVSAELYRTGHEISEAKVRKACEYCFSSEDFLENLFPGYEDGKCQLNKNLEKYLMGKFYRIRNQQETFRAVHRLSVIGIVDEYNIDYNSKIISLSITKRIDDYYIDKLISYIRRYDSPENVEKAKREIFEQTGDTIIRKCCGYLTDFVYRKIAAKRKEAIDSMEKAILSGAFTEQVNTYFDSKYIPTLHEKLYEDSLEWIWGFLDIEAINKDNISHILGACNRLLDDNPDNLAYRVMRVFARITHSTSNIKVTGLEDLHRVKELMNGKGFSNRDYMLLLSQLFRQVLKFDKQSATILEPEFLNYHLDWLKNFNNTDLGEDKDGRYFKN